MEILDKKSNRMSLANLVLRASYDADS